VYGDVGSSIPPNASFSPDGKWVAYDSWDAGKFSLFVQHFPPTGTEYQAGEGGIFPVWSRNGDELFYFHGLGVFAVMKVLSDTLGGTQSPKFGEGGSLKDRRMDRTKNAIGEVFACRILTVCDEVAERLKAAIC
jgi:hypothetical protein